MKLTSNQYVESQGRRCPHCGSPNIFAFGGVEADGTSAWGKVQCEDCLREWFDVYELSGYEVTDLEDVAAN